MLDLKGENYGHYFSFDQRTNVEKVIEAAVKLIDEGNTIPFISRYRKEVTGALNDEVLRNLNDRLTYLRNLKRRKLRCFPALKNRES